MTTAIAMRRCEQRRAEIIEAVREGRIAVGLNIATVAELACIKIIGRKKAHAIVAGRPYATVEEVARVRGIGRKAVAILRQVATA